MFRCKQLSVLLNCTALVKLLSLMERTCRKNKDNESRTNDDLRMVLSLRMVNNFGHVIN